MLNPLSAIATHLVQVKLGAVFEPSTRPHTFDAFRPLIVVPCPAHLQSSSRNITGCGVDYQRFDTVESLGVKKCDMRISAKLPEQGLGMPQHEMRLLRPRQ